METGDYTIEGFENIVCVERKASVSELASWFYEKRCYDTLQRMTEYPYRYLIFDFDLYDVIVYPATCKIKQDNKRKLKSTPKSILKKLNEIHLQYDIPYIFTSNPGYSQQLVVSLFKRILEIEL